MKFLPVFLAVLALAAGAGCKPKPRNVPPLQRMQAANLVSEAQFAVTLHDYARAQPLYEQAAKLCPDNGDYWVNLGMTRRRLGDRSGAKAAYEQARSAYDDAYRIDPQQADALLQEVYVLALLGRVDDARATLEKERRHAPDNRALRVFSENHQLDRILEDPVFKEIAL